jgi:hypothetical protein
MKLFSLVFSVIAVAVSAVSFADTDSSAIDSRAMTAKIEHSTGVVLRVPINAAGQELGEAAEMRVVKSADSSTSSSQDLVSLFNAGVDASKVPQLDSSTTSGDTSTCWGWRRWNYGYGWNNRYYYTNYQPTYYYYGNTYNYSYRSYYNYYSPYYYNNYNCWGYRYYYYYRY